MFTGEVVKKKITFAVFVLSLNYSVRVDSDDSNLEGNGNNAPGSDVAEEDIL